MGEIRGTAEFELPRPLYPLSMPTIALTFTGEAPAGGEKPSPDDIHVLYQEVCKGLHQIDDFRGKLLALLPLSSGAGIFLLLKTSDSTSEHLWAIGLFGAVISFGLGLYELRQTIVCGHLVGVGAGLEKRMNFKEGQFLDRPAPSGLRDKRERWWHNLLPSMPMASVIVYVTVILGWIYLAFV